ncbi:MAG: phage head morphogenesis protein [Clostridia bacterium]|nr:phage head morphogenesis protein [Clostridia bacterium]
MKLSTKWKNWVAILDSKICNPCKAKHGKIYEISEEVSPSKLHPYCRCTIQRLKSLFAGEATDKGMNGADWHLKYKGKLPEYYIDRITAKKLGWKKHHSDLSDVAPGSMLYGGVYQNKNSHLPEKDGRVWYEADVDYESGSRNTKRVVFSNDGLIFVTYDHYETFIEIR